LGVRAEAMTGFVKDEEKIRSAIVATSARMSKA